eukprot:6187620-Pleurochrysis_carterae.AAC.2
MIGAANTFYFSEKSQQAVLLKAAAPHLADKNAPRRSPYKLNAADSSVELISLRSLESLRCFPPTRCQSHSQPITHAFSFPPSPKYPRFPLGVI